MSYQRPDQAALGELEELLRHVGEEAAAWRRRSLKAEAEVKRLKQYEAALGGPELAEARQRVAVLEGENEDLRRRIELARQKVAGLARRLSFLDRNAVSEAG